MHIKLPKNIFVSLKELICAMSCIIAMADNIRQVNEYPINGSSINSIVNRLKCTIGIEKPQLSKEENEKLAINQIVHHYPKHVEELNPNAFVIWSEETILSKFRKVVELMNIEQKEMQAMLDLFSNVESELLFNPFYKIVSSYYFSYETCCRFNLNRLLYDNYISVKLLDLNLISNLLMKGENYCR
ncbi:MAG: hypothetical protein IPI22_13580 [Bacteroidetes bacterium]|nr:hypothetical protein [Bacteroidota bacterium]